MSPPIPTLEWLTRWPDDLVGKIEHAGKIVNWLLGGWPARFAAWLEDIQERAEKLWQQILEVCGKVVDWFANDLLPGIWAPVTLYQTAQSWTTDVFAKITDVSGRYEDSRMQAQNYWHGPAQRAYVGAIGGQRNAAKAVSGTVKDTHDALQTLALALGAVYVAIAAGCVLAGLEISGGTATLFGVITIPAGLAVILKGLLVLVLTIAGGYAAFEVIGNDALQAMDGMKKAFNDNTALDKGHWPTVTGELRDGSMTDGDRSGWTFYADPTN